MRERRPCLHVDLFDSEAIGKFAYDLGTLRLVIFFKSGGVYEYQERAASDIRRFPGRAVERRVFSQRHSPAVCSRARYHRVKLPRSSHASGPAATRGGEQRRVGRDRHDSSGPIARRYFFEIGRKTRDGVPTPRPGASVPLLYKEQ